MKMIATGAAVAANTYPAYVHNCLRNAACERSYSAPLPDVYSLQLYVDFGNEQPLAFEIHLLDTCNGGDEQIFPSNYVIGKTPEGTWYGVFKYFNTPVLTPTTFVIWLSAVVDTPSGIEDRTFFSEMLMIEPCARLMKIKSCQPEGATTTGFDVNGIYYGLAVNVDFLGNNEVRYFHIAWVRLGKVREMSNKGTFKSSLIKNFRTTIEKIYQLETELVPQWYKDELLAIYARGAVQVNDDKIYLVSDLAFEALNDDDLTWKPYAQLKDTFRLFYGCDDSQCVEGIIPDGGSGSGGSGSGVEECIPVVVTFADLPDGAEGVPYFATISISGTAPFTLSSLTKPAWMSIFISGNFVMFSGTPGIGDAGINIPINYTVNNCETDQVGVSDFIDIAANEGSGGTSTFGCESAAEAITDITFNGVSVTPVGGSFPMLPGGPPMGFFITNPAALGALRVFLSVPDVGNIRIVGNDSNGFISCVSGMAPAFLELVNFNAETSGSPVTVELLCGICD